MVSRDEHSGQKAYEVWLNNNESGDGIPPKTTEEALTFRDKNPAIAFRLREERAVAREMEQRKELLVDTFVRQGGSWADAVEFAERTVAEDIEESTRSAEAAARFAAQRALHNNF
jgi:hypothetical protein